MKRLSNIFGLLLLLMVTTACPGPVSILYQVDVTVGTSALLRNFKGYRPDDEEMISDGSQKAKLLIQAFVYDEDGSLLQSFSELADNYGASYSFTTKVACASPTIVVFSYCILGNVSSPSYQAYVVSGQQSLNSLEITRDTHFFNIPWMVLGGAVKKMDSSSSSANIELSPLGGVVYIHFKDIHAHDSQYAAPDTYTFWHHSNNIVRMENGRFIYDTTLTSTYSFTSDASPSDFPSSQGVYVLRFIQPGTFDISASYEVGSDRYFFDEGVATVSEGKQYVAEIDCSSYKLSFREGYFQ